MQAAGQPWTIQVVPTPFHPLAPQTPTSANPGQSEATTSSATVVLPDQYTETYVPRLVFLKIENQPFSITENALRLSSQFRAMLDSTHIGEPGEGTEEHPITLNGVTSFEMESFLTILSARVWAGPPDLTEDGWAAALHIATMYSFRDIRNYIIKYIDDKKFYNPVRLIEMASKSNVPKWIQPAYLSLCMKPEVITPEEAARLGFPIYTALCRIREQVLKKGLSGVMQKGRVSVVCHHNRTMINMEVQWSGWPNRQIPCDQCVEEAIKFHVPEQEYLRLIKAAPELNIPNEDAQDDTSEYEDW